MIAITLVNAIDTVSPQVWFVNVAIDYKGTIYRTRRYVYSQPWKAPYLYLLARSGGSVKDQIIRQNQRPNVRQNTLKEEISVGGKEYRDRLQYFPGDSPAHAMEAGQTIVDSKADRLNIVWSPCYSTYSSLRSSSSSFMFNDHSWSMTIIGCLSSDQHILTTSRPYTFKILSQLSLGTVTARVPLPLDMTSWRNQETWYFYTVHGVERVVKFNKEPMDTESIISDDEVQFLLRVIIHPFLLSIPFRVHMHKLVSLNKMGQVLTEQSFKITFNLFKVIWYHSRIYPTQVSFLNHSRLRKYESQLYDQYWGCW